MQAALRYDRVAERETIAAALAGGENAFFDLFTAYRPVVTSVVRQRERDPDTVEDLVQTTFIRAFRSLGRFRGDASFGTWITRIAINVCLSARRQEWAKRSWMSLLGDLEFAKAALAQSADVASDAQVMDRERREIVTDRLERLPASYRSALQGHYIEDRSYGELARELDVPMGTLKTWMNRARQQMAHDMRKDRSLVS